MNKPTKNPDFKFDFSDFIDNPERYDVLLKAAAENKELTKMVGELVSGFDAARGIDQTKMNQKTLHLGFTVALLVAAVHLGVE